MAEIGKQNMSLIPGVILAGGLATRMRGVDKCLLHLDDNTTLLDSIIARLKPQCGLVAINANGDEKRFSGFRLPVISDSVAEYPGPLGGILAAMDWAAAMGAQKVLTVAGDSPFFPVDLVERMSDALVQANASMVFAQSTDEHGQIHPHPTFGIWDTELRDDLRVTLIAGQKRVRSWAARHNAATAVFPFVSKKAFLNINTPADLKIAQECFQSGCV